MRKVTSNIKGEEQLLFAVWAILGVTHDHRSFCQPPTLLKSEGLTYFSNLVEGGGGGGHPAVKKVLL